MKEREFQMEGLMNLLSFSTSSSTVTSALDGAFSVSQSTLLLIVAISFIGTNLVSNITSRQSMLEYVTTYCSLFVGSLLANWLISDIELPVSSDLAQTAITANIGMTCAALLIMAVYGREGYLNK